MLDLLLILFLSTHMGKSQHFLNIYEDFLVGLDMLKKKFKKFFNIFRQITMLYNSIVAKAHHTLFVCRHVSSFNNHFPPFSEKNRAEKCFFRQFLFFFILWRGYCELANFLAFTIEDIPFEGIFFESNLWIVCSHSWN